MEKFKNRLLTTRKRTISEENKEEEEKPAEKDDWLAHEFRCQKEEDGPILAKDANLRNEGDWYDIYDPRNPINKRRRAEAELIGGEGKKAKTN